MNLKNNFRRLAAAAIFLSCTPALALVARATGTADPVGAINQLTGILVNVVKAIGGIACLWGVVQFGMSFQSHDTSQRTQGILFLVGGLIIFFAQEILGLIGVTI